MNEPVANLDDIYQFTGPISDENLRQFIKSYRQTLSEKKIVIDKNIKQGNWLKARADVHSIKSNSLFIGAKKLSYKCKQLEKLIDEFSSGNQMEQKILNTWQHTASAFDELIVFLDEYQ